MYTVLIIHSTDDNKMPVEIRNFHSAMRAEISSLITALEEYLASKKIVERKRLELDTGSLDGSSSETASTDSSSEVAMIREDFLSFIAVLLSHSDSEDALIFPVLFARTPNTRTKLEAFDSEHNKINSCLNEIKTQWSIFPVVHSERARICILEDILAQSIPFRTMLLEHLDTEEELVHPLMMDHLTTEEVNVIVGRVLGHRSSDVMAKILKLMYRHLSTEDFNVCLDNIQKSVSGTFFQKWLSALPQSASSTEADGETASLFEAGSVASEEEISLQNHSTVAGVMSGAIPGGLRGHALDHLRKDYDDPVHYSLEEVIQQENDRLASKNKKRKRRVALSELRISKKKFTATSAPPVDRTPTQIALLAKDLEKSYFDEEEGVLGCSHYRKKCKIIAPCCSKVFVCRLCHNDSTSDGHAVDRYAYIYCVGRGELRNYGSTKPCAMLQV